jgi:thymidylate synthase ThyX
MIRADVVCDSISPAGKRITSVEVTAHRFILAEINTHRALSRNYRSSRAVPVAKMLEEVRTNPAMPVFWGKNQAGMQAAEELDDTARKHTVMDTDGQYFTVTDREMAKRQWRAAAGFAAIQAESLAKLGLHKQIANRVLEPYLWVHGIITATDWDNFFGLRLHRAAQPEFKALADAIWPAIKNSEPEHLSDEEWHLPYIGPMDWTKLQVEMLEEGTYNFEALRERIIKTSVARCARVSTTSFETGKRSTWGEDLRTYARLNIPGTDFYDPEEPIHASPAEHQARPDYMIDPSGIISSAWANRRQHGNFDGWRQYRKMLPGENCAPLPKEYQNER